MVQAPELLAEKNALGKTPLDCAKYDTGIYLQVQVRVGLGVKSVDFGFRVRLGALGLGFQVGCRSLDIYQDHVPRFLVYLWYSLPQVDLNLYW